MINSKDLIERFESAFSVLGKAEAGEYKKTVETNVLKFAETAERSTYFLLGLIAIFYLVSQNITTGLDFGFVKLEDKSIILLVLPVLVSYFHYDLATTLAKINRLTLIYKIIIEKYHKPIYDQKLTGYFLFYSAMYEYKYFSADGVLDGLQVLLWSFRFILFTFLVPVVFQVLAFWSLILKNNLGHPVLFVLSLITTVLLTLQSVLIISVLLMDSQK